MVDLTCSLDPHSAGGLMILGLKSNGRDVKFSGFRGVSILRGVNFSRGFRFSDKKSPAAGCS